MSQRRNLRVPALGHDDSTPPGAVRRAAAAARGAGGVVRTGEGLHRHDVSADAAML